MNPSVPSFDQVMRNIRRAPTVMSLLGGADLTPIDDSLGSGGIRPRSIKTTPFYDNLSLDQMRAQTQPIKPSLAGEAATTWNAVASRLGELFTAFEAATTKGITANWSGQAAGAALAGTGKFVESGNTLADAAAAISLKLDNLSRVLAATKQGVQPAHYSTFDNVTSWLGVGGPSKHADEVARAAALNTLNNTYTPGLRETDTLPLFAQPTAPGDAFVGHTAGDDEASAAVGATSGGGSGATGFGGHGGTSSGANADARTQQHGHGGEGSSGGANASQGGATNASGSERATAADVSPGAAPHDAGAAKDGSGIGGSGGDGGGGLPATPTVGAVRASPQTSGVGRVAPARAPQPGLPGMSAAPAGKKDEDKAHRSPSYLVNLDNGNRLIGPLGGASPAVIGIWEDKPEAGDQNDAPA